MRVLAILRPRPTTSLADFAPLLVDEERQLWKYMAEGSCRGIHYHAEAPGTVVLDFEGESADAVRAQVDAFPFVRAGLFDVETLPLAPYQGLAALFAPEHGVEPSLPPAWTAAMRQPGG